MGSNNISRGTSHERVDKWINVSLGVNLNEILIKINMHNYNMCRTCLRSFFLPINIRAFLPLKASYLVCSKSGIMFFAPVISTCKSDMITCKKRNPKTS